MSLLRPTAREAMLMAATAYSTKCRERKASLASAISPFLTEQPPSQSESAPTSGRNSRKPATQSPLVHLNLRSTSYVVQTTAQALSSAHQGGEKLEQSACCIRACPPHQAGFLPLWVISCNLVTRSAWSLSPEWICYFQMIEGRLRV